MKRRDLLDTESIQNGKIENQILLNKNLRTILKKPSAQLKLISNFSSTDTEISKISSLIVTNNDITTNIAVFIPNTKTVQHSYL